MTISYDRPSSFAGHGVTNNASWSNLSLNPHAATFVPRGRSDERRFGHHLSANFNDHRHVSGYDKSQHNAHALHRVHPQFSHQQSHQQLTNSCSKKGRSNLRTRTASGQAKTKPNTVEKPVTESSKDTKKEGRATSPKTRSSSDVKEPSQRYQILVPEISGDLRETFPGSQKPVKKVTWFSEDVEAGGSCVITTDDPHFNRDLKRGERFATIPPTTNEKEENALLRQLLENVAHLWDDDDFLVEQALSRHRLSQATHVRPLPAGINPLEVGTYKGLFTLPWVMQVHRDFPDDAMRAKLALARATCLRGLTEENLDPEKGELPLCLVNWGLLQDPHAAKRRQKEKQEEEKWQEDTREVWMHQVVAEGIYEQKSKTLYPHEFGSPNKAVSDALEQ